MRIELREQPFDPWAELERFQSGGDLAPGSYGACATFVGSMRDFNQGDRVSAMHLQHYPGMTERLLSEFAARVMAERELLELLVIHRVGDILPNQPIVLVAAWSAHRAAAFDGCREMMEHLKSMATFWKNETLQEGAGQTRRRWADNPS